MKWSLETTLIHTTHKEGLSKGDYEQFNPYGRDTAIVNEIIPAVGYAFPNLETAGAVVAGNIPGAYYGRYGNPTTAKVEEKIAELEQAEAALGVSSGMAAITVALLAYLKQGDHVIVTKDVYGGTFKFITAIAPRSGIDHSFVDCRDLDAVERAIQPNTKVLYLETPSNPCLTILDIKRLSELAHRYQLKVIVDNTFMTPLLQQPLVLGADIVVHSATKYLNGHGDVLAGFVVGSSEDISMMRKHVMGDLGQPLNAWEAYLILRGLKTLALRMRQHCASAWAIAEVLQGHKRVKRVYYPGLPTHPQYDLAQEQMRGMGGIVSFEVTGGYEGAKTFLNSLQLALISFSLGDPETLVQHPASMTHSFIPQEERESCHITDGLIRLSTGLENTEDIIADLLQALDK
ncbi:trans-sulfuration enzyme family protein [Bacillus horti]|uniref:Methionine-gamma-lyase n=1 Tax=Caldalkalibacillus horti TaxID=77523 RepID=A0ABT9VVM9_9BACI|nr:aminotransferase class I/II-fold pyridoxal phosphate-dependent enzyme [Bacillus horti]MDQ0165052.1 methionine-gamma-lyase [Bacillus horti]